MAVLPTSKSLVTSYAANVNQMNAIMMALREYQAANGQLPCPADPTLAIGAANYGVAAVNVGPSGNCINGTPSAAYADTTNHIAIGMVPVKSLGLSNSYAIDAFGRDISYMVDTNATSCQISAPLPGTIKINDYGVLHTSVVALVSHGKDGFGAWLPLQANSGTATRFNSGSLDSSRAANAQVTAGTLTAITPFVTLINQSPTSTYDDYVVYKNSQWNINALPKLYSSSCPPPYFRTITIDHTKVPNNDQTNFPMLFSGTYSYLKTQANGGYVSNTNGYDITFSSDVAGTSKLNFERENYNASTGEVEFWVQIPTLSHSTDTVIYLHYDDSSVTTDQQSATSTWDSNYKTVLHMGNLVNSTTGTTAVTNAASGNISGTTCCATNSAGQIANAYSFTAASDQTLYNTTNPMTATDNFTMSMWAKPASSTTTYIVLSNGADTTDNTIGSGYSWGCYASSGTQHWIVRYPNGGAWMTDGHDTLQNCATSWTYLTLTRTSGTSQMYVNGVAAGSTWATAPRAPATIFSISGSIWANPYSTGTNWHFWYGGLVDEVRLSITPRSADWISAEYANQNSPGSFYAVGSQYSVSGR